MNSKNTCTRTHKLPPAYTHILTKVTYKHNLTPTPCHIHMGGYIFFRTHIYARTYTLIPHITRINMHTQSLYRALRHMHYVPGGHLPRHQKITGQTA